MRKITVIPLLALLLISFACAGNSTVVADGMRFVVDGKSPGEGAAPTEEAVITTDPAEAWDRFSLSGNPPELESGESLLLAGAVIAASCEAVMEEVSRVDSAISFNMHYGKDECPMVGEFRVYGVAFQGPSPRSVMFEGRPLPVSAPTTPTDSETTRTPTAPTADADLPNEGDPRTWPPINREDYVESTRTAEECMVSLNLEPDECYEQAVKARQEAIRAWEDAQD